MKKLKILICVGARPNFMKVFPLIEEIEKEKKIEYFLVHTGQHYDDKLSEIFFDELGIPRPNINLGIGSMERNKQINAIMIKFKPIIFDYKPDLVIVVGDVNSTLACAVIAKKYRIKVAHVEAGLRSNDLTMVEEQNRIETDKISDFLFVTESSAIDNLKNERIIDNIYFVGNVMIDSLIKNLNKIKGLNILNEFRLNKREYAVCTIHRPSNVDRKGDLIKMSSIFKEICKKIKIVLPLHPRTKNSMLKFNLYEDFKSINNLKIIEPLGYLEFLNLILNCKFVLTDSGGIQEETTYLKIPCITMRDNTERPVTVYTGSNTLTGNNKEKILKIVNKILNEGYKDSSIPQYWDGESAKRIISIIKEKLQDEQ